MITSCPRCNSKSLKRNGFTRHGKQNQRCLDCGKQFSSEPNVSIVVVSEDEVSNKTAESCPFMASFKTE